MMNPTLNDVPAPAVLLFAAVCAAPALVLAVAHAWRGRETRAHEPLVAGLRMAASGCGHGLRALAIGCGYVVVGLVCVPVLALHYVDKYWGCWAAPSVPVRENENRPATAAAAAVAVNQGAEVKVAEQESEPEKTGAEKTAMKNRVWKVWGKK
ncbi:hypothetical protein GGR52DRAFT_573989 [Hypoxylon sp. FL1284]|nr:hypothetical protein GGR52DRAFT_573989 [Hypoxylon sp. FL1284]